GPRRTIFTAVTDEDLPAHFLGLSYLQPRSRTLTLIDRIGELHLDSAGSAARCYGKACTPNVVRQARSCGRGKRGTGQIRRKSERRQDWNGHRRCKASSSEAGEDCITEVFGLCPEASRVQRAVCPKTNL